MNLRGVAVAVVLAAAGQGASAAETINGRWAMDPEACSGFSFAADRMPLVVTDYAVRWRGDSCRIARMYKTGRDVHIQAQCWGADGERSVPVSLRPQGQRLQLRWDRVVAGDLKRCE